MAGRSDVLTRIREIAEPIVESEGLELVDLEYRRESRGWVLRLIIDRPGGISIDDCASVSREVEENLDVEEIPPGPYTLEVSSPGLDRPLKKAVDFQRFVNQRIRVITAVPIENCKKFRGKLVAFHAGVVEIDWNHRVLQIPLDQIVKANLEYEP